MKFTVFLIAVPLLAQTGGEGLPIAKERAFGQKIASDLSARTTAVSDPAINAYITSLGLRLVAQLKEARYAYEFPVIADGRYPEPLPILGGHIFVPLRSLANAQSEGEFAGLLAHCIAHVALQHGSSRPMKMGNSPLIYIGSSMWAHGDASAGLITPATFVDTQKANELEADQLALQLLSRAGYDVKGLEHYVERTQGPDRDRSPLPSRRLRLTKLHDVAATLPSTTATVSDDNFLSIQKAARSILGESAHRVPTLQR